MKEIALVGTNNRVFAHVLSSLLSRGVTVNAMVDFPEKVMVENSQLTVGKFDYYNEGAMKDTFEGYHDVVLTYDDNLRDAAHNEIALKSFEKTLTAVRQAGVSRVVVVAGMDSEAYFTSLLRRIDDIDWVFISTEGDYATRAADEVISPRYHREIFED